MSLPAWLTPELINTLIQVVEAAIILVALVLTAAYMIWLERRLLGLWQDRYGPNRVGFFGLGQVIADMIKIFFKEDWTPPFVDRAIFWIAPAVAMSTMMLGFLLVPITPWIGVSDLNLAVLLFLALCGLAVYAVMLGGWASNNKYALLGGLRSSAQMISYEVFLGLSLMGVVMQAGSFSLVDVVHWQQENAWNIVPQFFGFCTFLLAGFATVHRAPFDLPEAEQELADGYHVEYSSMKFGMFFVGEYVGIVLISALIVVLFFGGWDVPFVDNEGPILALLAFVSKCFIFMSSFILMRASLPRPRYDHMMAAGWKVCLPLTLINVVVTGIVILMTQSGAA